MLHSLDKLGADSGNSVLQRRPEDLLWLAFLPNVNTLCINQSDVLERKHQVLQMGEVYTGAADVIAWLGGESEDSDLAFEAIDALPKSDQVY
jgi:Heterokaryon incompatibility protein (HET)